VRRTYTRTAAIVCSLLLGLGWIGSPALAHASPTNVIPDDGLRHCIAQYMQNAGVPFSASTSQDAWHVDILTQTDLDAFVTATTTPATMLCQGVSSLTGIQGLRNLPLASLMLTDGQITDLTPLVALTGMTALILNDNQISDLTPLAGLTNLQLLGLDGNQITDLTPLARLTNLQELGFKSNQITDLTPLAGLTNLTILELNNTPIADLTPLAGLTRLTNLNSDHTHITDLRPLANLTTLSSLSLVDNQIADLTTLAGLTTLVSVDLSNNQIADLTPLAGLTTLDSVDLSNNQIADLTPLAGLTQLSSVSVDHNQVADLNPLAQLTTLSSLTLDDNLISDITPLEGLPNLGSLNLANNHISDVSVLASLPNLTGVNVSTNRITDITPIATQLNRACSAGGACTWSLDDNHITDLSPLDWNALEQNLLELAPYSENNLVQLGVFFFGVRNQTIEQTAHTGTVPLPTVVQATNDPTPIMWSVKSGPASLNQADGTVTFTSPGVVTLAWTEYWVSGGDSGTPTPTYPSSVLSDFPDPSTMTPDGPDTPSPTGSPVTEFFSGTVQISVTGPAGQASTTMIVVIAVVVVVLCLAGVIVLTVRRTRRTR